MEKEILIIALLKCSGIGNKKVRDFILLNNKDYKKSLENIKNIVNKEEFEEKCFFAKEELIKNKEHGIQIITILNIDFPEKLYNTRDPIIYLYYKGDINLINQKNIAIIGTRTPTDFAKNCAKKASGIFSEKGYVITSGLALGCDINAHIGCINSKGKTIAVLPSGLNNIQPKSNEKVAIDIVNTGGCLISEYSVGSVVNKYNFAKRDRIQSAISDAILVIEASENSGTMIAVKKSIKENKVVYMLSHNNNSIINNTLDLEKNLDLDRFESDIRKYIESKSIENSLEDSQISFLL